MPNLDIRPGVTIDGSELSESFARSSGPGGQNVNKVSTAVELRFSVALNQSLPVEARARLMIQQAGRVNKEGELVIFAQTHRSQERNRADARARLARMVLAALDAPKPRAPTRPTQASVARRLETKKRTSMAKRARSSSGGMD